MTMEARLERVGQAIDDYVGVFSASDIERLTGEDSDTVAKALYVAVAKDYAVEVVGDDCYRVIPEGATPDFAAANEWAAQWR